MTKKEAILAGLLALVLLWAGYGAYKESLLKAQLQTSDHDAKNALTAVKQEQAKQDAIYQARIDDLTALKQRVVTVTQVVHELPTVLKLPEAISQVTQKQADGANAADPTAKPIEADDIVIPKADAKPLFDAQVAAQECAVDLSKSQNDYSALQKEIAIKDDQIKQRDIVIKGGTKWQRAKTGLKWFAIGAAISAAAIESHR